MIFELLRQYWYIFTVLSLFAFYFLAKKIFFMFVSIILPSMAFEEIEEGPAPEPKKCPYCGNFEYEILVPSLINSQLGMIEDHLSFSAAPFILSAQCHKCRQVFTLF